MPAALARVHPPCQACLSLTRTITQRQSRRLSSTTATKAASSSTSSTTSSSRSKADRRKETNSDAIGTWPNSFEPLVLDSRYIGHYRDPSKHDSFALPISRRGRAAWFAPSTVNPIVAGPPGNVDIADRQSKARSARREMEKAWGATTSDSTTANTSKTSSKQARSSPPLTALLMPGSGSQYVGMASFLDKFKAARETWEEAEYVGPISAEVPLSHHTVPNAN